MKLAGPSNIQARFTLHPDRLQVTVCGVFPPERATFYRTLYEQIAHSAYPGVRAEYDQRIRQFEQELIYGKPGQGNPVGLLSREIVERKP